MKFQECVWEIRADPGYMVTASFVERFDLENTTECRADSVELFDQRGGDGETWTSLGRFCGKEKPPQAAFVSAAERLKIVFRSNEALQFDGFRVRPRPVPPLAIAFPTFLGVATPLDIMERHRCQMAIRFPIFLGVVTPRKSLKSTVARLSWAVRPFRGSLPPGHR